MKIFTRITYEPVWNTEIGQGWVTFPLPPRWAFGRDTRSSKPQRCRVESTAQPLRTVQSHQQIPMHILGRTELGVGLHVARTSCWYSSFNKSIYPEERKSNERLYYYLFVRKKKKTRKFMIGILVTLLFAKLFKYDFLSSLSLLVQKHICWACLYVLTCKTCEIQTYL